jgi:hypothetical protein
MGLLIGVTVVLIVLDGIIYGIARICGCSPAWIVIVTVAVLWSNAVNDTKKVAAIPPPLPMISAPAQHVTAPALPTRTSTYSAPTSEPAVPYGCKINNIGGSRVVLCFDQG